jgi:acyl carrier protein
MSQTTLEWIQVWVANRRPGESIELKQDTDLYKSGLLDSLGIIELIESLEDHYGFMFTDEEMQAGLTNVSDFERIISARA